MSAASATLQIVWEKAQLLSPQRLQETLDFIEFLLGREDELKSKETNGYLFDSGEQQAMQEALPFQPLLFDWADGPEDEPVALTSINSLWPKATTFDRDFDHTQMVRYRER